MTNFSRRRRAGAAAVGGPEGADGSVRLSRASPAGEALPSASRGGGAAVAGKGTDDGGFSIIYLNLSIVGSTHTRTQGHEYKTGRCRSIFLCSVDLPLARQAVGAWCGQ